MKLSREQLIAKVTRSRKVTYDQHTNLITLHHPIGIRTWGHIDALVHYCGVKIKVGR